AESGHANRPESRPAPAPANVAGRGPIITGEGRHQPTGPDRRPTLPVVRTSRDDAPVLSGMSTVMASGALALLMGGLGAWGYERYLDRSTPKDASQGAVERVASANSTPAGLDDRMKELASQVDELRDRLAKLPKSTAPDFGPVNERIATLEGL